MSDSMNEAYDTLVERFGRESADAIADYVGAVSDNVYKSVLAKVKAALGA